MARNKLDLLGWHPGVFTGNRDGWACRTWPINYSGTSVVGFGDTKDEAFDGAFSLACKQIRLRMEDAYPSSSPRVRAAELRMLVDMEGGAKC